MSPHLRPFYKQLCTFLLRSMHPTIPHVLILDRDWQGRLSMVCCQPHIKGGRNEGLKFLLAIDTSFLPSFLWLQRVTWPLLECREATIHCFTEKEDKRLQSLLQSPTTVVSALSPLGYGTSSSLWNLSQKPCPPSPSQNKHKIVSPPWPIQHSSPHCPRICQVIINKVLSSCNIFPWLPFGTLWFHPCFRDREPRTERTETVEEELAIKRPSWLSESSRKPHLGLLTFYLLNKPSRRDYVLYYVLFTSGT